MALTDFWEIKDNQVFRGKSILNVYHAKRILVGANASLVAQAFVDFVISGDLDQMQSTALTRTTVEVANLGDETDFAALNSSAFPGILPSQTIPAFNAATIQFNRTRNDMKNGAKRFLVFTELENTDGAWVPGAITLLNSLSAVIMTPWEEAANPGIDICEFVILKRFCVVPAQDPCVAYRLPNSNTEVDENHYVPVTATTRTQVRSQVSRKILL